MKTKRSQAQYRSWSVVCRRDWVNVPYKVHGCKMTGALSNKVPCSVGRHNPEARRLRCNDLAGYLSRRNRLSGISGNCSGGQSVLRVVGGTPTQFSVTII